MVGLIILFTAAGVLTSAWLGGALVYVSQSVGWDNLMLMMPNDLALFAFGVFGPVALLWLVLGLIQTTLSNHRQEGVLRQMVVQERRASDQIEAQVRTLIQMQGESRRRSVIDGMDLVLKDLNGQAAVLAERLGMISQDEADTLWGRTVSGDVWAFSYAFLTRAEAYDNFPDLLAERLAHDEISSSALQLFLRRYELLLESFRETDADKLARAVLEDGPLARLHSLFAAVNLRAIRLRQGYDEIPGAAAYTEIGEGVYSEEQAYADGYALHHQQDDQAGYYPAPEAFELAPDPEPRPRFGVEDVPDDFGVPHDEVLEREHLAQQDRERGLYRSLPDDYAPEPLAQEGYAGSDDFSIHRDRESNSASAAQYDYRPLVASPDDAGIRSQSARGGYGQPIPGGRSTWTGKPYVSPTTQAFSAPPASTDGFAQGDDVLVVGAEVTAYTPTSFHAPQFVRLHEPTMTTVGGTTVGGDHEEPVQTEGEPNPVFDLSDTLAADGAPVEDIHEAIHSDEPLLDPIPEADSGAENAFIAEADDEAMLVVNPEGDVLGVAPNAVSEADLEAEYEQDHEASLLSDSEPEPELIPEFVNEAEYDGEPEVEPESIPELQSDEQIKDEPSAEPQLPYAALSADGESMEESMARLHDVLRRMNSDDDAVAPAVVNSPEVKHPVTAPTP